MQLTHPFEVPGPVGRVFDVFSQLDLLAPCFPGATVWGRDGDVYHGAVKIKFGPFPLVFEGTARVVRVDVPQRRLVVKANARDRRGAAAGSATATATFRSAGEERTAVEVVTELDLTGRPAQLGAGAIASVSDRLKEQFVACIGAKLASGLTAERSSEQATTGAAAGRARAGEAAASTSRASTSAATTSSAPTGTSKPGYAYVPPTSSESAPHLQVLPDVARTWAPWVAGAIGALTVLALVVRWRRSR